ncbi:hypothetical protein CEXT_424291 [Caerostris extrusa]|uniref:Uncharacterized protein n=1 Tax=Caerostris extrusa TaxID=172846 RepID=A0AAV4P9I8_CAEEX|nr:hypothetical protein CEXT_424291 [Caerostris extrusa]
MSNQHLEALKRDSHYLGNNCRRRKTSRSLANCSIETNEACMEAGFVADRVVSPGKATFCSMVLLSIGALEEFRTGCGLELYVLKLTPFQ